nr:unnamed protein product [Digitaria exilis]
MAGDDDLQRHQVRLADNFYAQLGCAAIIAHPKLHLASGDLFALRRASQPTMIHNDFAIAENHHPRLMSAEVDTRRARPVPAAGGGAVEAGASELRGRRGC